MKRILLVDADSVAFKATAATQTTSVWDGEEVVRADFDAAKDYCRDTIDSWVDRLEADDVIVCLSDDIINFRKKLNPTYKSNRIGSNRPVYLYECKDWLAEQYTSVGYPTLEADDVMGILASRPSADEIIMVAEDKDMLTIPGKLFRPHKPHLGIIDITEAEADWYHMYQTLIGDTTDGYSGCPGVGPQKAENFLTNLLKPAELHTEISRGKNKGKIKTTWVTEEAEDFWDIVKACYFKAGLKESDALLQARMARILRDCDYDGKPILWKPPV